MGQGNGSAHGDHIPTDQRQLHARLTLGNAIAHRRYATGHLPGSTDGAQRLTDLFGKVLVGLVGGEHVVVGADHAHIHLIGQPQQLLVPRRAGGHTMGQVAAGQIPSAPGPGCGLGHLLQIGGPGHSTALTQTLGYLDQPGMHVKSSS